MSGIRNSNPLYSRSQPGGVQVVVDESRIMGAIFWVDNSNTAASDAAGFGFSKDAPLATIDYAVGLCVANKSDYILVGPGHVENFTGTNLTADIAGINIVGLGKGSIMPRIIHDHANAEVSVAADNVTIQGIRQTASVTGVLVGVEIEDGADYCTVRGCKYDVDLTGTDEFLVSVRTNDASNNALIELNAFDMGLGGAVAAISFTKDTDSTIVRNNSIIGDYSTACINGITTLSTNLDIRSNLLCNGYTNNIGTEPAIELLTGSTGVIRDNYIVCNLATKAASIVADTCILFNNYYSEDISGAATGGIIGTASADD